MGPRYAISESICIIYVDVDHYKNILDYLVVVPSIAMSLFIIPPPNYKNILDYLLGVPSIGKINPIFFCNN